MINWKAKMYLFEGQEAGNPYSDKSLQSVLKQTLIKAGIKNLLLYIGCDTVMPLIYLRAAQICVTFKIY